MSDTEHYYNIIYNEKWEPYKKFNYPDSLSVQTYHCIVDGSHWYKRSNTFHSADLYEKFKRYLLGLDDGDKLSDKTLHTKYETQYIHSLESYEVIDQHVDGILMRLIYDIGSPFLRKREFNELICIYPLLDHIHFNKNAIKEEEISIIIQKPIDNSSDDKNTVKAMYCSIEVIIYNKISGELRWDMCTTSDAKGILPLFVQRLGVAKLISQDVPSFLNFISSC